MIERVFKEEGLDDVLVVQDMNGVQMRYLLKDGVLHPGRVWRASCRGDKTTSGYSYDVTLFLPFPDGAPEVLKVREL